MSPRMRASLLVTFGIPLIAIAVVSLVIAAVFRSAPAVERRRRLTLVVAGVATWLSLTAGLALLGFYADFEARPPRALFLMIPTIALPIVLGLSRIGKDLAMRLSVPMLVGFHMFRVPLELVMHVAAREGTMPEQMTFTGWNFDILTGLTALALVVGFSNRIPRRLAIAWNLLGTGFLVAIGVIAVASLPLFHAFGTAPHELNTWVAFFPFVWLPAALVSSALLGHVVLFRRLFAPLTAAAEGAVVPARST